MNINFAKINESALSCLSSLLPELLSGGSIKGQNERWLDFAFGEKVGRSCIVSCRHGGLTHD